MLHTLDACRAAESQERIEMGLEKAIRRAKNWMFKVLPTRHSEKLLIVDALGNPGAVSLKSGEKKL